MCAGHSSAQAVPGLILFRADCGTAAAWGICLCAIPCKHSKSPVVGLLHGPAQQMLRFGLSWARCSSDQLVWLAVCAEPQMVYVVHSLATATELGGLQTAGTALRALCFLHSAKISQNRSDLCTELSWILLQDPVQNIYKAAIFLQLKSCSWKQQVWAKSAADFGSDAVTDVLSFCYMQTVPTAFLIFPQ